jgi:hypothetical protein
MYFRLAKDYDGPSAPPEDLPCDACCCKTGVEVSVLALLDLLKK